MPEEFRLTSQDIESSIKKRKKLILLSASVAIALILAVSGYFIWKQYTAKNSEFQSLKQELENLKKEKEKSAGQLESVLSSEESRSVVEVATEPAVEDKYANWNSYSNKTVGYQLRYPADWKVEEVEIWSELVEQYVKYIKVKTPDGKNFLYFGLKKKDDDFAISDRSGVGSGDLVQEGSIFILGTNTPIKKLVHKGKTKEYFFPSASSQKTEDGKYYFSASFSSRETTDYDSLNLQGLPEIEKAKLILESLKIIERAATEKCSPNLTSRDRQDMEGWKTFKNDKYDYSFKYPKNWSYEKSGDKLVVFKTSEEFPTLSWRSEEMTALGFEGWETDQPAKDLKVACQNAKSRYLKQDDGRMIYTQFKKNGKDHLIIFNYRHLGASASSDLVEMYDLILKSVEFKD